MRKNTNLSLFDSKVMLHKSNEDLVLVLLFLTYLKKTQIKISEKKLLNEFIVYVCETNDYYKSSL